MYGVWALVYGTLATSAVALAVAGLVHGLRRSPTRTLFRLVIAAAVIDVVMLLIGGAQGL